MSQSHPTPHASPSAAPPTRVVGRFLIPMFIATEFLAGLIQGWIIPLLSEIGSHYSVGDGPLNWVLTVGLLSSAICVPFMTMLADRVGAKRMLVVSAAATAVGSLLIALAPSFPLLLLGAAVQGPVAVLLPLEMATLKEHRPMTASRNISFLVGMLTIGVAVGSIGAGSVMEWTGNLLLTQAIPAVALVLATLALIFAVPATRVNPNRNVDWWGAVLLGLAVVGLMYGLSNGPTVGWLSTSALLPALFGLIALVAFIVVEQRVTDPLFDIKLLRRVRLGVPLVLALLAAMVLFGSQTPMVVYLTAAPAEVGYGAGVSPAAVGMIFAITGIASSLGSFTASALLRVVSTRYAILTAALLITVTMVFLSTGPSMAVLATAVFAVTWFALGILLAVLPGVVVERVPEEVAASVSGIYNTARTIGGSISGAMVATIMTMLTISASPEGAALADVSAPFSAFRAVFLLFAALGAIAAVLAFTLRDERSVPSAAEEVTK
ncbi:MAG: MFS transporter [Ancrocorticia sp.]